MGKEVRETHTFFIALLCLFPLFLLHVSRTSLLKKYTLFSTYH